MRNPRTWRAFKSAALQIDLNGNGLYDEGDTVRYTITVVDTSASLISSVLVTDTLPPNTTYVANTTYVINDGTPPPAMARSRMAGLLLFHWTSQATHIQDLNGFSTFSIRFDVTINPTDPFVATRTNSLILRPPALLSTPK